MSEIKNVAIFGGSGELGTPLLSALLASGKFNISAITRETSTATFPSGVKVIKADYDSLASLTPALQNQDAVVSAVGNAGMLSQKLFIDAAIAANVSRFIPSEFGCPLSNPKTRALPVFAHKVEVREYLEEKIASGAKLSYTYVINNAFLDWGLDMNFILTWKSGKPKIFDGGERKSSFTTLESVGKAVVGVLSHPEETKDRDVYIHDLTISQNDLLRIAKKADPERKFEVVDVHIEDVLKGSFGELAKGDYSFPVMAGFLEAAIYGVGYGSPFEKVDNELLGVKGKTEEDVEAIFKELYAKEK